MTAPSPARSLDADLAAFWRALGAGFPSDWREVREARLTEMHKRYATRRKARRVRRAR